MKKRILLFTTVAAMGYLIFTSYATGPGIHGYDCTGAETGSGNPTGCSATGVACHGSVGSPTTGITVTLELDSAGVTTSSTATGTGHYKPGFTYTVKITGVNTTTNTLPKFGFQVCAIKGSTAVVSPINVGTLQSTGLPAGLQYTPGPGGSMGFIANVVEHSMSLSPTTGTGGNGTTYVESFTWTAPIAGTGTVSLWAALNAVNNVPPDVADAGDKWNTNHLILNEIVPSSVANVTNNINVSAFPNPVSNNLNLQFNNAQQGKYSIQVFDLSGRCISNESLELNSNQVTNINTGNWTPGLYQVVIQKEGISQIVRVVKNL